MTPAPRTDLAGRVLDVADAVERRVSLLTDIVDKAPTEDAIASLAELLWVAAMLRPLTAGVPRRKEARDE